MKVSFLIRTSYLSARVRKVVKESGWTISKSKDPLAENLKIILSLVSKRVPEDTSVEQMKDIRQGFINKLRDIHQVRRLFNFYLKKGGL